MPLVENKTASQPKNPTKSGYKFVEWQLDGSKYDFKTKVTKDITLKAKWEEIVKHTVTFDYDNGSNAVTKTVEHGKTVSKPSAPTKSGYTFVEWRLNDSKFDFNTKITEDITLVANYKKNEQQTSDTYKVVVTRVDKYSSDSKLTVLKNNSAIAFRCIKKANGNTVDGESCPSSTRTSMIVVTSYVENVK